MCCSWFLYLVSLNIMPSSSTHFSEKDRTAIYGYKIFSYVLCDIFLYTVIARCHLKARPFLSAIVNSDTVITECSYLFGILI